MIRSAAAKCSVSFAIRIRLRLLHTDNFSYNLYRSDKKHQRSLRLVISRVGSLSHAGHTSILMNMRPENLPKALLDFQHETCAAAAEWAGRRSGCDAGVPSMLYTNPPKNQESGRVVATRNTEAVDCQLIPGACEAVGSEVNRLVVHGHRCFLERLTHSGMGMACAPDVLGARAVLHGQHTLGDHLTCQSHGQTQRQRQHVACAACDSGQSQPAGPPW